jgi:hypothetical protein
MLYEHWREFEEEHGNEHTRAEVANNQPKRVKKRRKYELQQKISILILILILSLLCG